ncbi:MAG: hypothetical protein IPI04_14585 [Ignavibacteria bacterium]|nr:hypothetical protein [Ignavibacteria bacterium]
MIGRLKHNKLIIYGTGTSSVWNNSLDKINSSYNFNITKNPEGFVLQIIPAFIQKYSGSSFFLRDSC